MIDPVLSLAVSMHAQKGVYALLLGSGVSRSAGVPTGWEVVLDLASRLARVSEEECVGEAAASWYTMKYGEQPDYSRLLDALTATPAERQQLLRGYFEPTEDETERGIKSPTAAHRAIAELVSEGQVRVVLTTNFDRLTERAIEAHGFTPTVISSGDAAEGASPLTHSQCTVIKLHGDYLDARLKNTEEELATYDPRIASLLDRVLDEYGLIVCGWSAQWDIALRAAFERRRSRRFSIYWVSRGEPNEEASRLINFCGARLIRSEGADFFFPALAEKVRSLRDLEATDPLAPAVAAATVKRYLVENRYRIRLHDVVVKAVRETAQEFDLRNFAMAQEFSEAEFLRRMKIYEVGTEVLRHMMVPVCGWGGAGHEPLVVKMMELATDYSLVNQGAFTETWKQLRLYPSLLLLYTGGIAALAVNNYGMFSALLAHPNYHDHNGERPLLLELYQRGGALRADLSQFLPGYINRYTPASDYIFDLLRPLMNDSLPQEYRYADCFDRFEYLLALVFADLDEKSSGTGSFRGPIGRFMWRQPGRSNILQVVADEIEKFGPNWPPLKFGLFGGSVDRLSMVKEGFDTRVADRRVQGL